MYRLVEQFSYRMPQNEILAGVWKEGGLYGYSYIPMPHLRRGFTV